MNRTSGLGKAINVLKSTGFAEYLSENQAKPQACRSGTVTTSPSNSSRTLIWQESREFGRTS